MKSKIILILLGVSSSIIVVGVGVIFAYLWPHVFSTFNNAIQAIIYTCYLAWQDVTRSQLAFSVLGAVAILSFIGWAMHTWLRVFRMAKKVNFASLPIPRTILSIAAAAGLDADQLRLINEKRAFAMTMGIRSPYVVITTRALKVLNNKQLKAVFEHEAHHVKEMEPLRRLLLTFLLLWVPIKNLRNRLRENYITSSEIEADECVKNQHFLGEALIHMVTPPVESVGFSSLDVRIERLVNPNFYHSKKSILRYVFLVALTAVSFGFLAPRAIAMVYGTHPSTVTTAHLDMCRIEHERLLQSREQNCGPRSTPQSCVTK